MSVMTRIPHLLLLAGLAFGVSGGACAGSETGNGRKDGDPQEIWFQLGLDERPALSPLEAFDRGGALFRLESARGAVSELVIRLDKDTCRADGAWRCGADGDEGTLKVSGAFEVDLLGGPVAPALLTPSGLDPEAVRAFVVKWGGTELPTLDVSGTVRLAGETDARPFGLTLDFQANTRFVLDPHSTGVGVGLAASGREAGSWGLALDPSSWFEAIDLSGCVRQGLIPTDADGVLRLEGAERACRSLVAGVATGFRLDGVADVFE